MTQLLFTVLLIAICPLMMFFMMRGMNGSSRGDDVQNHPHAPHLVSPSQQDARIAELESEVARLSRALPADTASTASRR